MNSSHRGVCYSVHLWERDGKSHLTVWLKTENHEIYLHQANSAEPQFYENQEEAVKAAKAAIDGVLAVGAYVTRDGRIAMFPSDEDARKEFIINVKQELDAIDDFLNNIDPDSLPPQYVEGVLGQRNYVDARLKALEQLD